MAIPAWSPDLLLCYPLQGKAHHPSALKTSPQAPALPAWVQAYRPKRLKRPKGGRIFQVPRQKTAMRDARVILNRLRHECRDSSSLMQTDYIQQVLRLVCPFIFEELLLHCCADMGWRVIRSSYTHDGGIDGTFFDEDGAKFLIQAKRYSGDIDPEHLLAFSDAVWRDKEATAGIFMHTGSTCAEGQFIEQNLCNISILEGCGLREFILQ